MPAFDFLNLKTTGFGLDISDSSIKIAKLKKRGGFLALASFIEKEVPAGIINDGEIKDEDALAEIIKKAVSEVKGEKLKSNHVIISLPEEKAFLQIIQVPKMNEEELRKAIKFEAENYIPLPVGETYIDFQPVQPYIDHLDHADVLVAALPRKIVDPYVAAVKKAGLIPLALEIESLAIARAVVKNGVSPFPLLLIDLGASRSSFIVFGGYAVRFTFSILVSSSKFTEVISRSLKIDINEAEKKKVEYGLETRGKKEGQAVFESLIPAMTDLVEQVKIHLRYYQTHSFHEHLPPNGRGVEKIVLCGGGANLKGLADFISKDLMLPVEIGNPWVNILPEKLTEIPGLSYEKSLGYTTALGLALRALSQEKNNKQK